MTMRMPETTSAIVFCSGEQHRIVWRAGRLFLPHHNEIAVAAIEGKLLSGVNKLDHLCLAFAGAMQGDQKLFELIQRKQNVIDSALWRLLESAHRRKTMRNVGSFPRSTVVEEKLRREFARIQIGRGLSYQELHIEEAEELGLDAWQISTGGLESGHGHHTDTTVIEIRFRPKKWAHLYNRGLVFLRTNEWSPQPVQNVFGLEVKEAKYINPGLLVHCICESEPGVIELRVAHVHEDGRLIHLYEKGHY
jgi:hypothetical protein